MTSNDAAEDAINLDDDALIEACLGFDRSKSSSRAPMVLPDWPPPVAQRVMVGIDPATAEWFQSRSRKSWRRDIDRILRAWITAHTPTDESGRDPIR
ncbi:MAG TPA: hypothetical protein VFG62_15170 [Rhodopila sp.]|nr:hypothetical protein [Rhodopila sp.]